MISVPRGIPVKENVNPARINLPEAMGKLQGGTFSGYLRFDESRGAGIILFENGKLVSALFESQDGLERLIAYDAIARIFEISILGDAALNIYRFSSDLALGIHAMLHGQYVYKQRELDQLDIHALLRRIREEQTNCVLRVCAEGKVVLIYYDLGEALGFFHEGASDIETTADLSASLACLPDAKLDLLEVDSFQGLMLADLMTSADLGPIWQRARKVLLEGRRKREEKAVRVHEEEQELKRQWLLIQFKTIAGNHIGKFGVSQVEKAFEKVSTRLLQEEMVCFYLELQKLSKLVAGPPKIRAMIGEMREMAERDD